MTVIVRSGQWITLCRWAKEIDNTKTKKEFYPTVDKKNLFKDGYIDSKSGHSRGSTLDLTIVPLPLPQQQDYIPGQKLLNATCPQINVFAIIASIWEPALIVFMNYRIRPIKTSAGSKKLTGFCSKRSWKNMDLKIMIWSGGTYTLKNEPYPDTYFDFPIE